MGTVADRSFGGFAAAQEDLFGFLSRKDDGLDICSLVLAIAERLSFTETTSTPCIFLALG